MSNESTGKLIEPPNKLINKVIMGGPCAVNEATLVRAEQVVDNLLSSYLDWASEDLSRIQIACDALKEVDGLGDLLDAVFQISHDIKGQGIYAYVTLMSDVEYDDALISELVKHVRKEIGAIASPDIIQWAPGLPKTRSGKIMRRILRKIAANEVENLGDTSTLADPSVVTHLIENRANK